ncbi:LysR substrate-binding domain-containing protein [Streptacidiphilus sp. PAMC 29251]
MDVLERLSRAEQELTAIHAGQAGVLRVGAFATANISLVPAALRAFKQARPDVEVIAAEGRSSTLMRRLAAGTVDLAVVSDYPSGLPRADGVTRAGFRPREVIRIAEWSGKFGYAAAGLGVVLVPSLALWAVPAELAVCRLDDTLRRTVHTALPATPLPAALTLRDLLHAAAGSL